jgi:hypothetical protein
MVVKDNNNKQASLLNLSPGINVGATMDYRVIPELTINASLLFSTKGYMKRTKEDFQSVTIKSVERLTTFYIELPLYAKYEFYIEGIKSFAGIGPFVGYGYWGKYNWRREGGGETEWGKEDVYWGEDPDKHDLLNWDYGVGLTFGGKIDNFVLDLGYHFSIPNISTNTDNSQVKRNAVVFVSVSYFFSKFYKYSEANY